MKFHGGALDLVRSNPVSLHTPAAMLPTASATAAAPSGCWLLPASTKHGAGGSGHQGLLTRCGQDPVLGTPRHCLCASEGVAACAMAAPLPADLQPAPPLALLPSQWLPAMGRWQRLVAMGLCPGCAETGLGSLAALSCPLSSCCGALTALVPNSPLQPLRSLEGSVIPISVLMVPTGRSSPGCNWEMGVIGAEGTGCWWLEEEDSGCQG